MLCSPSTAYRARSWPLLWRPIAPLAVAITLYHVAMAGFTEDPVTMVGNRMVMVELGAWLLARP